MDNDQVLNFSMPFFRKVARVLCIWFPLTQGVLVSEAYAGGILFPNTPMASSVDSVKPNVLFMLDDSTSMGLDYLPDYVRLSTQLDTTAHTSQFGNCFDTGDTGRDITGNPADCMVGDPPHMTSSFNSVYYNPAISYTPPVKADGTSYPSQSTWTAVDTDPYGQQRRDQLDNAVSSVNLVTGYPDRVWCISPSADPNDTNLCRKNTTGYVYPDDVYKYGFDYNGVGKYAYGSPYYYNLLPRAYCDNVELKNWVTDPSTGVSTSGHCQDVSSPVGAYQFPAAVQWCEYTPSSSTIDYAQVLTYYTATNHCQGKRLGNYSYPRFLGSVAAGTVINAAYATIPVQANPAPNQIISAITVGNSGPNILNGSIQTGSSDTAATIATSIAQSINLQTTPVSVLADATATGLNPWEFIACAGSSTTGQGCAQAPFDTYIIDPTNVPDSTVYVFPARPNSAVPPVPVGTGSPKPYDISSGIYPQFQDLKVEGVLPSVTFTIPSSSSYNVPIAVYDVVVDGVSLISTSGSPVWASAGLTDATAVTNFVTGADLCSALNAAAGANFTVSCSGNTVTVTAKATGTHTANFNVSNTWFRMTSIINTNYAAKISAPTASYAGPFLISNIPVRVGAAAVVDTNALGASVVEFDQNQSQATVAAAIAAGINGSSSGLTAMVSGGDVYVFQTANPPTPVRSSPTAVVYQAKYCTLTATAMDSRASGTIHSFKVNGIETLTGDVSLSPGQSAASVASAIAAKVGNGFTASTSSSLVQITNGTGVTACADPQGLGGGTNLAQQYGTLTTSAVTNTVPAYVTGVFVNGGSNLLGSSLTEAAGASAISVAQSIQTGISGGTGASGVYAAVDSPATNVVYVSKPGVDVSTMAVSVNNTYGQLTIGDVSARGPARISSIVVDGSAVLPAAQDFAAGTLGTSIATTLAASINSTHTGGYYAVASGNLLYIYNASTPVAAAPTATVISDYGIITTGAVTNAPIYIRGVSTNGLGNNLLSATITEPSGSFTPPVNVSASTVASDLKTGINANSGSSGYTAIQTAVDANVYVSKPGTNVSAVSANVDATYGKLTFAAVSSVAPAQVTAVTVGGTNILGANVNLSAGLSASSVASAVASQINSAHVSGYYAFSNGADVYVYNNASTAITANPSATIVSSYGIITAQPVSNAKAYISTVTVNGSTTLYSGTLTLAANYTSNQVAAAIASAINGVSGFTATSSGAFVYIYKQGTNVTSVSVTYSGTYGQLATTAVSNTVPAYITGILVNGATQLLPSASLTEVQSTTANQVASDIASGISTQGTGYQTDVSGSNVYISKAGVTISSLSSTVASSYGLITPTAVSSFGPARITNIVLNGTQLLNGVNIDLSAGDSAGTVANAIKNGINAQTGTTGYYAVLDPVSSAAVYVYKPGTTVSAAPTVTIVSSYGHITAQAVSNTPAYINSITVNGGGTNLITALTEAAGTSATTVATDIKNSINARTGTTGFTALSSSGEVYIYKLGTNISSVTVSASASYGILDATGQSVSSTVPAYITGIAVNGAGNIIPSGYVALAAGSSDVVIASAIKNAINADSGSTGYTAVLDATSKMVLIYKNGVTFSSVAATAVSSYGVITPSAVSAYGPARITSITANSTALISGNLDFNANDSAVTVATAIKNAINARSGTSGFYATLVGSTVYLYKPGVLVSANPTVSIVSKYGTLTATAVSSTVPAYVTGVFVTSTPAYASNLLTASRTEASGSTSASVAADLNTGINTGSSGFNSALSGSTVYVSKLGTDVTGMSSTVNSTYGQVDVSSGVSTFSGARITGLTANATNLFGPGGYVDLAAGATTSQVATAIYNGVHGATATNGGYDAVLSGTTVYVYNPSIAISAAPSISSTATYGTITPNGVNSLGWAQISSITVSGTNIINPASPLNLAPGTSAITIGNTITTAVNNYTGTSGYSAIEVSGTVYVYKAGTAAAAPVVNIIDTYATLTTSAISNTAPAYITGVFVTSTPAYVGNLLASTLTEAANTSANQVAIDIAAGINGNTGATGFSAVVSGNVVYISRAGYAATAASINSTAAYASLTPSNVGATPASVTGVYVNGGGTNIMGGSVGPYAAGTPAATVAAGIAAAINAHSGTNGGYYANVVGSTVYVYSPSATVSSVTATSDATYAQLDASSVTIAPARINQITVMGTNLLASQIVETVGRTGTQVASDIVSGINSNTGSTGYAANSSGNSVFIYKSGVAITSAPSSSVDASYGILTANAVSANGRAEISVITVNGTNVITGQPVDLPAGTSATAAATAIATAINASSAGYSASSSGANVYIWKQWVNISFGAFTASTAYGTLNVTSGNTATTPTYITGVFVNGGGTNLLSSSITVAAGASATTIAGQIVSGINGGSSGYWAVNSGATVYVSKYGTDVTSVSATYNATYGVLPVTAVNTYVPAQISNITVMGTNVLGSPLNLSAGTTQANVATAIANAINAGNIGGYYAIASATDVRLYNPSVQITTNPTATVISGYGTLTFNAVGGTVPSTVSAVYANGGATNLLSAPRILTAGWTGTNVATQIATDINANTGGSGYSATSNGATVYIYKVGTNVTSASATLDATYGTLSVSAVSANGPALVTDVTINGSDHILASSVSLAAGTTAANVAIAIRDQINATHTLGYYAVASGSVVYIYNSLGNPVTSNPTATVISNYGVLTANAIGVAPAYLTSVYVNGGATNLLSATRTLTAGWTATQVAADIVTGINGGGSGYSASSSGSNVYIYKSGVAVTSASANVNATYGQLDLGAIGAGPVRISSVTVNSTDLFAGHVLDFAANTTATTAASSVATQINTYGGSYKAISSGGSVYITNPTIAITTNPSATIAANYGVLTTSAVGSSPVPIYITGVYVTATPAYAGNLIASTIQEAANTTANQVASDIVTAINNNTGVTGYSASSSANQVFIYKVGSDVTGASATAITTYGKLTIPSAVNAYAPAQVTDVTVNSTSLFGGSPRSLAAGTTAAGVATAVSNKINGVSSGYSATTASNVVYIYSPTNAITANPVATIVSDYGLLTASPVGPVPAYVTGVFVNGGANLFGSSRTEAANSTSSAVASDIATGIIASSLWNATTNGAEIYVHKLGTNVSSISATINNATYAKLSFSAVTSQAPARISDIIVNGTHILAAVVDLSAGSSANSVASAVAAAITGATGYYAIASNSDVYVYNPNVSISTNPTVTVLADYGALTFTADVTTTVPAYVTGVFVNGGAPNLLAASRTEAAGTVANSVASDVASGVNANTGATQYSAIPASNVVYVSKIAQPISSVSATINSTYGQITFNSVDANVPARVLDVTVNGTSLLSTPVDVPAGSSGSAVATAVQNQINATHTGGYYAIARSNILYVYNPTVAISTNPSVTIVSGYGTLTASAVSGPVPASIQGVYANGGATNLIASPLSEASGRTAAQVAADIAAAINANTGPNGGFLATANGATVYVYAVGVTVNSVSATVNAGYGQFSTSAVGNGTAYVTGINVNGGGNILASDVTLTANSSATQVASAIAAGVNGNTGVSGYSAVASGANVYVYNPLVSPISSLTSSSSVTAYGLISPTAISSLAPAYLTDVNINGNHLLGSTQTLAAGTTPATLAGVLQGVISGSGLFDAALDGAGTSVIVSKSGQNISNADYTYKQPYALLTVTGAGATPVYVTAVTVNGVNALTSAGIVIPPGTSATDAATLIQANIGNGFGATASGGTVAVYSLAGADIGAPAPSITARDAYVRTIDVGDWIGGNAILGGLTVAGTLIGSPAAATRAALASSAATAIGNTPAYLYYATASSGVVTIYGAVDPNPSYTSSFPADAYASGTISIGPAEGSFDTASVTGITIIPGGSCTATSSNLISGNTQTATAPVAMAGRIVSKDRAGDTYTLSQNQNMITVTEISPGSYKGTLNGCSFSVGTYFPGASSNPPVFTMGAFAGGAGKIADMTKSSVSGGGAVYSAANGTVNATVGAAGLVTSVTLTPTAGLTTMSDPVAGSGNALAAPALGTGSSLAVPTAATGTSLSAPAELTGVSLTAPSATTGSALAAFTPGFGTNGNAPSGSSAASMSAPAGNHNTTTTAPSGSTAVALTTPSGGTGTTTTAPSNSAGNALATPSGSTGTGMTAPTYSTGTTTTVPSTATNVSLTLTPAYYVSLTFTYGNGSSLASFVSGNGHSTSAATVSTGSSFTNPATSNGSSMAAPTGGSGDSLAAPTLGTGSSLSAAPAGSTANSMSTLTTSTAASLSGPTWTAGNSMSAPTASTGTTMSAPVTSTANALAAPTGSYGVSTALSYSTGTSQSNTNSTGVSMPAPSVAYVSGSYALSVATPPAGSTITVTDAAVGWPGAASPLNISVASTVTGSIMVGAVVPFTLPTPGAYAQRSNVASFSKVSITNTCSASDPACYGRDASGTFLSKYRINDCVAYRSDASDPTSVKSGWSKGCTYEEEMTNFANWYAYYRTRMQTMKTTAGLAFNDMGTGYRIGFLTIHANASQYTHIADFDTAQRTDWYSQLYGTPIPNGAQTPLRSAVSIAGRIYAGKSPVDSDDPVQYSCQQNFLILTTDGFWLEGDESKVVKLDGSTQIGDQDHTYTSSATTDPYYDGDRPYGTTPPTGVSCPLGKKANGVDDEDGCMGAAARPSCSTPGSCNTYSTTDPAVTKYYSTNTLADVARYYYNTDLRDSSLSNCTGGPVNGVSYPVCENNVFKSSRDLNQQQHMTMFTLGLGVEGVLNYVDSNYENATSGDYYDITHNSKAWPQVKFNDITGADDMWHAAVNSQGIYFSAKNPVTLSASLKEALHDIQQSALGSSGATSNPVPEIGDNFIYAAAYTTLEWTGQVTGHEIDLSTGYVGNPLWCVSDRPSYTKLVAGVHVTVPACDGKLKYQITAPNDSFTDRHIYLYSSSAANKLREFEWSNLTTTEQSYFRINQLYQYTSGGLSATAMGDPHASEYMVRYLRGEYDHDGRQSNPIDSRMFRVRKALLGDVVGAQPVYVKSPRMSFTDAGYANFVRTWTDRAPTLYVGANDGMLHAFDASTVGSTASNTASNATTGGRERWAYIPSQVMPKLWKLAQDNGQFDGTYFAGHHVYTVNGTPTVADVCVASCDSVSSADWRTILVGSMKEGGRGYFAVDVTDPSSPKGLWEFTPNSSGGTNVGYAFGAPVMTKYCAGGSSNTTKTCLNPRWVVLLASGYNNSATTDPAGGGGDGKGYVFMVDPLDGSVIRTFSTNVGSASSPSGLAHISAFVQAPLINSFARYVYGGDLTGRLYRFDLETDGSTADGVAAEMRVIASLTDPGGNPQPVTTAPSLTLVSAVSGGNADKRLVVVGTGKYLEVSDQSDTQVQTLRGIFDRDTYAADGSNTLGDPRLAASHMKVRTLGTPTAEYDAFGNVLSYYRTLSGDDLTDDDRGWYIDLGASVAAVTTDSFLNNEGERIVVNMPISNGILFVPTSVPRPTSNCSPGGVSWVYELNVMTGLSTTDSGGKVSSYAHGGMITGVTAVQLPGGISFITSNTASPDLGTDPHPAGYGTGTTVQGRRSSWREILD